MVHHAARAKPEIRATTDYTMAQLDKILQAILYGRQDQNLRFTDLTRVITALGFTERIKGSHHIYTYADVEEIINP